jgi:lambda repressor-like predicted transcriptional regulator
MSTIRTLPTALALVAVATVASAQGGLTREQVKAELAEARRTGDIVANGETGQKLNELYPDRYPPKPVVAGKTRAEVKAELAEAIRTGDLIAGGEAGLKANELWPGVYPMQARHRMVPAPATTAQHNASPAR